ncbi:MAG: hypothetical protein GXP33_09885 [Spirochaetes bacterium]|nr:hypothetical protein [Spirochaetota bacterium]
MEELRKFNIDGLAVKEFLIFGGRIGSGKTEIAVNLAIKIKQRKINSILFDMDIVKPYVRIRDIKKQINSYNLSIVSPPDITRTLDLPIYPPYIIGSLMEEGAVKILDIGGDPYGAGSIAQFRNIIESRSYNFYFVINTKRPETSTGDEIIASLKAVEHASRLKVTHFILNTNLRWETTGKIVREGYDILKEVSVKMDIPIAFGCVDKAHKAVFDGVSVPVLPLELFVKPLPELNKNSNGKSSF